MHSWQADSFTLLNNTLELVERFVTPCYKIYILKAEKMVIPGGGSLPTIGYGRQVENFLTHPINIPKFYNFRLPTSIPTPNFTNILVFLELFTSKTI